MPVAKRRKNAAKHVPKPRPAPVKTDRWARKLHSSRLMYLRDDPDFLAMIKVGRAMNALLYALADVLVYQKQKNLTQTRQYRRGGFVLGGYLHEAITVVDRIKGRYLGNPAFEPLRVLVVEAEHRDIRKCVRKIRNYLAFHLDESDRTTRQTLANLKPSNYTVMAGDDKTLAGFYFEFADFLDMTFLVENFSAGREWDETADDIILSMQGYALKFLEASHEFQVMLWNTKIGEHLY